MARKHARSRLSNGSSILPTSDGRSLWARLFRDTYAALIAHCGGEDAISETRRMAARRVAALEAELIYLEDQFASKREQGKSPDNESLALYGTLADRQRRLSDSLGWERKAKDITPDLQSYLSGKARHRSELDGELVE